MIISRIFIKGCEFCNLLWKERPEKTCGERSGTPFGGNLAEMPDISHTALSFPRTVPTDW
jgi:hypothetical protein